MEKRNMKIKRSTWVHIGLFAIMVGYMFISPVIEVKYFLKQGKPVEWHEPLPESSDLIRSAVDVIKPVSREGESLYRINGWSFLTTATDLADYDIYFVLRSDRNEYLYATTAVGRRDIQKAFPDVTMNLKTSGFVVYIAKETLALGEYEIGFLYRHKISEEVVFQATDGRMLRTPNTLQLIETKVDDE